VTVEARIEALVIQWLAKYRGIEAVTARIGEDDWDIQRGYSSGCDTCGYGDDPDYLELTIWYTDETGQMRYIEEKKDPLSFLAELLKLEGETK
jgi:hypothetical protein